MSTLVTLMNKLNRRRFSNNTQRVLHTLIIAKGEWVPGLLSVLLLLALGCAIYARIALVDSTFSAVPPQA